MTSYISQHQTKIEEFRSPFELKLTAENRWVQLAALLPWDTMANIYYSKLSRSMGRKTVNARIVIGTLIIKHKLNLSDEETLLTISENPSKKHTGRKRKKNKNSTNETTLRGNLVRQIFAL